MPVGGGVGIIGVLAFLAIQLLWGGGGAGGFQIPAGFDACDERAERRSRSRASQDPDSRPAGDFSVYVFKRRAAESGCGPSRCRSSSSITACRAKLVLYRAAVNTGCGSRDVRRRPVLLPRRPPRLPRPLLLPRHGSASSSAGGRFRAGVRDRARGRPSPPAGLGTSDKLARIRLQANPTRRTTRPCGSSYRRTATPASGRPRVRAASSSRRHRGGVTRVRGRRRRPPAEPGRQASTRTRPPTARRRSGAVVEGGRERGEPADCDRFSTEESLSASQPGGRLLRSNGHGTLERLHPLRHCARSLRDRVGKRTASSPPSSPGRDERGDAAAHPARAPGRAGVGRRRQMSRARDRRDRRSCSTAWVGRPALCLRASTWRTVPDFNRRVYDCRAELSRPAPRGPTATSPSGSASRAPRRRWAWCSARNPFPIVVPCHRVVAADGTLRGFSAPGGLDTKRRMLAIEDATPPALFD